MKKGLTHIICVLDKSGSMQDKEKEVITGFNNFVKEQRQVPGEAKLSLVMFDTTIRKSYLSVDIQEVKTMTERDYVADGFTALLDAVGICIVEKGKELAAMKEDDRPEHVIVTITTDGLENASKEYNRAQIRDMIKLQQDTYKWTFIFLGANQDAFAEGNNLGISKLYTNNYRHYNTAITQTSAAVSFLRSGDELMARNSISKAND